MDNTAILKKHRKVIYEFHFENGRKNSFEIQIDTDTVSLVCGSELKNKPSWARLDLFRCDCCLLETESNLYCPVALNIAELVDEFKDTFSHEKCLVRCITDERVYEKSTDLQNGLFSAFGLINACGNCPTMKPFKKMAYFHLPFATLKESILRAVMFYLTKQYFIFRKGGSPDIELQGLEDFFENIRTINGNILKRLHSIMDKKDAHINAFIMLNCIAQYLTIELDKKLETYEHLFSL